MRILILGGDGMLGHRLLRHLQPRHDVRVTLRQGLGTYAASGLFRHGNSYPGVDVRSTDQLMDAVADFEPEAMVNCVGIVKQRDEARASLPSIQINALLPHRLALVARAARCRLVHLSTDCVFSGRKGGYTENDIADAEDLYGRSKLLGEVAEPGCITLRTSIIGPELSRKTGLLEWFMAQRGKKIPGFRRAIYSGFTTLEMSRIIEKLLVEHPQASGLYHVSSEPISKYDLLQKVNAALKLGTTIDPQDEFVCDRSLDSSRFREEFSYRPPAWDAMISELADEFQQD
ncbi:MAG TPA: SDR family oxidoreductase [Burkholderiales bacterium]|nr:SDR family oxidoreductase [Burkholderiales bacterium]